MSFYEVIEGVLRQRVAQYGKGMVAFKRRRTLTGLHRTMRSTPYMQP